MGNWNISINGVGCHHNKKLESDANRMAAEFVAKLKAAGHSVSHASFTHGGEDNVLSPEYLAERDKLEG
jgi:hypothetical protein